MSKTQILRYISMNPKYCTILFNSAVPCPPGPHHLSDIRIWFEKYGLFF